MTTRKWHISPHPDHPHTRLDQLAVLAGARITRDRLRIPCPAHGGANPNLELKVASDRISAVCFSQGCSYRDIAQAIEAKFGISIGRGHNEEKTLARTERRPAVTQAKFTTDLRTYALKLWRLSIPIPRSSDHPARKWLDATAICGAQSCLSPGQCAGSAPNTLTMITREPEPSSPSRHSRLHGPRPGPTCQS